MAVLQTGQSFASGDQVTATKLQDIANLATFRAGTNQTADDSTIEVASGGYLRVPSGGITSNELKSDSSTDSNRAVTTDHLRDNSVTSDKLAQSAISALMPTGSIMSYAGSTSPSGYLLCDGAPISRTTYSTLFGIVGITYGAGDGSTTFNLPDLQGRVIAGKDNMSGTSANRLTGLSGGVNGDVLGASGGNETHLLTSSESGLPNHTHSGGVSSSASNGAAGDPFKTYDTTTGGVTGGAQDASTAHNNVQPTLILNYIIKT